MHVRVSCVCVCVGFHGGLCVCVCVDVWTWEPVCRECRDLSIGLPGFGGSASQLLRRYPHRWLFPEGSVSSFLLACCDGCPRPGEHRPRVSPQCGTESLGSPAMVGGSPLTSLHISFSRGGGGPGPGTPRPCSLQCLRSWWPRRGAGPPPGALTWPLQAFVTVVLEGSLN